MAHFIRSTARKSGTCKLTGAHGPFVKSHIIPQALTRPAQPGLPFYQLRPDRPPVRRWSSWYDPALVVQAGEDILANYDAWAVSELRRRKLVWSGWGAQRSLGSEHYPIGPSPWGIRKIEDIDGTRLRLFFLSLLWRAAATTLPEFRSVRLPEADLQELRRRVLNADAGSPSFYPTQLTQLSTLGVIHNHAPIAMIKPLPVLDREGAPPVEVPIFRFYFDGLIVHFDRRPAEHNDAAHLGNLVVDMDESFLVTTQTYEASFQSSQAVNVQVQAP